MRWEIVFADDDDVANSNAAYQLQRREAADIKLSMQLL